MDESIRPIVMEFRRELAALYGDRLMEVVLFGSRARGDAAPDSDIDVMVVLQGPVDHHEETRRVGDLASRLSLEYNLIISYVFMEHTRFQNEQTSFLRNVRRHGISIRADGLMQPAAFASLNRMPTMTEVLGEQAELLQKAREGIRAAKILSAMPYPDSIVSMAYESMMRVVKACLIERDLESWKPQELLSAFDRYCIFPGHVPDKFSLYLVESYMDHLGIEHVPGITMNMTEATAHLAHAEELLALAEQLLGPLPPND